MMETLREWYFAAGDWSLVLAGVVCMLYAKPRIKFMGRFLSQTWRNPHYPEQTTVYPDHVAYRNAVYEKIDEAKPAQYMPMCIALYGMLATVAVIMEQYIDKNIGNYARLEIWGAVGAIVGFNIFWWLGRVIGAIYGGITNSKKNIQEAYTENYPRDCEMRCAFLSGFFGIHAGIIAFISMIGDWHKLDIQDTRIAYAIPVVVIFIELCIRFSKNFNAAKFQNKYRNLICTKDFTGKSISEESPPLPPIVRPTTKEEFLQKLAKMQERKTKP